MCWSQLTYKAFTLYALQGKLLPADRDIRLPNFVGCNLRALEISKCNQKAF